MSPRTAPEAGLGTDDEDVDAAGWLDDIDDEDEDEPESPEPGEPEGPAAAAAQAHEDAELPGEARGEPEAPAQPEAPAASAAPPEAQPEATATAEVETPAEQPDVTPWTFTADGKQVTVQRSQVFEAVTDPATGAKERFVLIPESELQRSVQPHLADRGTWRQKERGYLEQIAQLSPEHNEEVLRAKELTGFIFSLLDLPEDQLIAAVQEFRSQRPVWDAKQEAAAARAQLEAKGSVKQEPDSALQQLDEQEIEEQFQSQLRDTLTEALKRPEYAGIPFDRAYKLALRQKPALLVTVQEDMPQYGLKKGERALNLQLLGELLTDEVEYAKQLRGRQSTAQKIEKANAAAVGTPSAPTRPTRAAPAQPKVDEEEGNPWQGVYDVDDE